MNITIVTSRAQGEYTIEQGKVIDSEFFESNLEIKKLTLSRSTDQEVFKQIALNDKETSEIRRYAISRSTDQSVFKQIALDEKESENEK